VTFIDFDPLAFILHILTSFVLRLRLVCTFCEAKGGSLSVANTAVSSTKVAVLDSGEVPGLKCIAGIIMALGHCLVVRPHWLGLQD
jgi:hypothetical protein